MSSGYDDSTAAARQAPWSSNMMQWRNWRLVVKLAAVVLVPVVFALTLGIMRIRDQIGDAAEFSRLSKVVDAAADLHTTIGYLQEERTRAADFLGRGPITSITVHALHVQTDEALHRSLPALRNQSDDNPVVRDAYDDASRQLARIPLLRNQVLLGSADPTVIVSSYSEVIDTLLALDRALAGQVSSPQLSSTANAVHALTEVGEEVRLQQSLVLTSLLRSNLGADMLGQLRASEIRRQGALNEFRAVATMRQRADYDHAQSKPEISAREVSLRQAMAAPRGSDTSSKRTNFTPVPVVPAPAWNEQSRNAHAAVVRVQSAMDTQLRDTSFRLYDNASNLAGLETVLLTSALIIAGAITALITRQLLGSLDLLRRGALHAASTELPQIVSEIRAGHGTPAAVTPVPVTTSEEVGQVARAFDAVHAQAIGLASEQAKLRHSYSDSFINVSRRSQSLLERQLRLFEHLERYEEDPDQLSTLFQLDHLATRMRRNNENLMVLAGSDLSRRGGEPEALADLLRAAVSEIEHYPRVIVHPMPAVKIVGYAANDVVRLTAELLDNAANFSAPHTRVVVTGHQRGDNSVGIDIVDRGIGMTEIKLSAANRNLSETAERELSTSRRMGLFVAGRLANRHGIGVELHRGPDNVGIRATITLKADLLSGNVNPLDSSHPNGFTPPTPGLVPSLSNSLAERSGKPFEENAEPGPHSQVNNGHSAAGARQSENQLYPDNPETPHERGQRSLFSPSIPVNGTPAPVTSEPVTGTDAATPIFNDLASAWFQATPTSEPSPDSSVRWPTHHWEPDDSKGTFRAELAGRFPSNHNPTGEPDDSPNSPNGRSATRWTFSSDDALMRAEEVSLSEPAEYTDAGLPRRKPQANLLAGSVHSDSSGQINGPQRNADLTRGRLARFQHGLDEGRHRRSNRSQANAQSQDQPVLDSPNAKPIADAARSAQDPQRPYTTAGLPQRTPQAQLAPREHSETVQVSRRDADQMRGRLSSFQRGVHEGKHSLHESTENTRDNR